jgi:hypothetical protein
MNLEREDRLFLRKAENALPKIISGRAAAKKSLKGQELLQLAPIPMRCHDCC